jgi:excisionase family DNA binding protein
VESSGRFSDATLGRSSRGTDSETDQRTRQAVSGSCSRMTATGSLPAYFVCLLVYLALVSGRGMAPRTRADTADAAKPHSPQRRPRTVETRQRGTPPSAAEITSAVHRALESVPASVRTEFVEAVADQTAEALDESLWGAGPSAAELRLAALQGLKDDFVARRDLLSASLSRSEVAELLGVSSQAVLDRLQDGDLVGLKDGREWRIPMWQVNAGAERGFLPGIAELRRCSRVGWCL